MTDLIEQVVTMMSDRAALLDYTGGEVLTKEIAEMVCQDRSGRAGMKPLGKPCHDCAVVEGFYAPYAAALALLDGDRAVHDSRRWHCHNHPNRACAGACHVADNRSEYAAAFEHITTPSQAAAE